jgi:hypothetical protein
MTHRIKHYDHSHGSVEEVKACSGIARWPQPATPAVPQKQCMSNVPHGPHTNAAGHCKGYKVWRFDPVTEPQIEMVRKKGGDVAYAKGLKKGTCSDYIESLIKGTAVPQPQVQPQVQSGPQSEPDPDPRTSAPNRKTTKVPLPMLKAVDSGYYASRPDSNTPYTFFRISRPKPTSKSKFRGALKIQTQHGPELRTDMVLWPSGQISVYDKRMEDDLLLVVVDPHGCARAYAAELGRCCRCNTELTDERSRFYGIGPECEKYWPHIIAEVEAEKGTFKFGSGQ